MTTASARRLILLLLTNSLILLHVPDSCTARKPRRQEGLQFAATDAPEAAKSPLEEPPLDEVPARYRLPVADGDKKTVLEREGTLRTADGDLKRSLQYILGRDYLTLVQRVSVHGR